MVEVQIDTFVKDYLKIYIETNFMYALTKELFD